MDEIDFIKPERKYFVILKMKKVFFKYQEGVVYNYPKVNSNPILGKQSDFDPDALLKIEFPQDTKLYTESKEEIVEIPVNNAAYNNVIDILKRINVNYLIEGRSGRGVRGYTTAELVEIANRVNLKSSGRNKADLIKDIKALMVSYNIIK